ncbi:hypothetical protein [Natronosalvus amylolyticus]|uniref:hypothetical protein n=1 Tax=Natronosalvus amylolyticus TaxID=2961994 RepID=UPI0020C959CF|nr:hypothetical protein [Natronosalvus amylolyticus]
MTIEQTICRRTALTGVTTGIVAALAGCTGSNDSEDRDGNTDSTFEDDERGPIQSITLDETQLVIDLERDVATRLNVIDPTGELFAWRQIDAGVSRTRIDLGFAYTPGDYEFIALDDDETLGSVVMAFEPNLEFIDLRLARDYPEEMYEGANRFAMEGDAILYVTNSGSGPTAITTLRFRGDVPYPTRDSYDETGVSGIYDLENDFSRDADEVIIPPGKAVRIYSNNVPFSPSRIYNRCETVGEEGQFSVEFTSTHSAKIHLTEYHVHYLTSDLGECQVEIEGPA